MNYFVKRSCVSTLFLLLIVVNCNCEPKPDLRPLESLINDYVEKNEKILGVLCLQRNGLISKTKYTILWEGILDEKIGLHINQRPVAVKFSVNDDLMDNERANYLQLGAYKNPAIEERNVAVLYCEGRIGKYQFIATTLGEQSLKKYYKSHGRLHSLNLVRVYYQVLLGLQYFFEKGMVHRNIKPANILLRGGQVLLMNFDRAEPNFLNKKNFGVSVKYGSLSACLKKQLFYIDDVKALFYGLLELGSNPLPWAKEKDINKIIYMKMNKDYILNLIAAILNPIANQVMQHLHQMVLEPYPMTLESIDEDQRIPNYNGLKAAALQGIRTLGGVNYYTDLSI